MGKLIETTLDRFDGGIVNDPRDPRGNICKVVTGFDVLTNPRKMTPYRDSESGDSAAATSQKQNFAIALRTGTTYSLYALGVKSGAATAEVLYKNLTTGASTDLDDDGWSTPANNQSASGAVNFNLFVYYAKTGKIYGARAGTHIWSFVPASPAWNDTENALAYTNIAQGLVHSKDDILYIPYDNKIAKNNNGAWTDVAITLPSHLYITSIAEYGNLMAIACAPLSGIGNSVVYLWDRDASLTTLQENINWGSGILKVLEEVEGQLIGISLDGGTLTTFDDRIIFRRFFNSAIGAQKFLELTGGTSTQLPIAKQKIGNRLFFMLLATINGATREGVFSIGKSIELDSYTLVHERTPNNDTALTGGVLKGFFVVGDFTFTSYVDNGTFGLSKTNDQASYTASAIYETKRFDGGDASLRKDLVGITVMTEFLPTAGQIVLEYRTDENTAWTNIFTEATNNSISFSANASLPKNYKEIEFRIESTGGAEVTALSFKEDITGKRNYN